MSKLMPRSRYAFFDTSIGKCLLAWRESRVSALLLPAASKDLLVQQLSERLLGDADDMEEAAPTAAIKKVMSKIAAHLEGNLSPLHDVEVDYLRVTPFRRRVYEAARRIPVGQTVTYGQLAGLAGSPAAARAIGQALACNPLAIIIPCHRVLGAGGKPVGFSAYGGCQLKERLLRIEGACLLDAPARRQRQRSEPSQKGMRFAPGELSSLSFDAAAAVKHIGKKDAVLAKLMARVGPFALQLDELLSPFEALAESIVYQQLTGKAAATIYGRVKDIYGGRLPAPQVIIDTPIETLRLAGLSGAKTAALQDLALKQRDGLLPNLAQLQAMSDEEIVRALTAVRGIGRWTVQMLLIFRLGRPDVLPAHDYGVRKGFAMTYKRGDNLPTPLELEQFGQRWQPFRSVAAWYMWRATELPGNKRKP